MKLPTLLSPSRCRSHASARSKKRVLELVSQVAADAVDGLSAESVFDGLIERERLGSTGLGNGVAIPHCRTDNLEQVIGVLVSLDEGVDFESIDDQPVRLICALIVPRDEQEQHLQALAAIAEQFAKPEYCQALLACQTDQSLHDHAVRQQAQ